MSGEHHGAALDVVVPASLDGERLDRALSFLTGVSRAEATELIARGEVRIDGHTQTRRATPLVSGSHMQVAALRGESEALAAEPEVAFEVVHEDDDVIVVEKPWDLVVHPGAGRRSGTLANGLLARYPELSRLAAEGHGDPERPGIVHRLDRGTSGLLVVARSARAFDALSAQMAAHTAERRYAALVQGHVVNDRGLIDAPLGRSSRRPTLMTVSSAGREARTGYEVVARYEQPFPSTLVAASLETGRTHQVRVHMAAIGHPVVGDSRYQQQGSHTRVLPAGRFFLHAFELRFDHPGDGHRVGFRSGLPADLVAVLGEVPILPE